jgi:hypothetical protein
LSHNQATREKREQVSRQGSGKEGLRGGQKWLALFAALLAMMALSSCGRSSPRLGLQLSYLKADLIDQIRSFRIMVFKETIYRCQQPDNYVIYRGAGYEAMTTVDFDPSSWDKVNDDLPHGKLFLPQEGESWAIQVEAYNRKRSLQGEALLLARGCVGGIRVKGTSEEFVSVALSPTR